MILLHIDFNKIPFEEIDLPALNELKNTRNLNQAQKAISDLGFVERKLEREKLSTKGLDSEGKRRLKNITDTKNYIQENMFKDKSGKVQNDLLNKHKEIQKGYTVKNLYKNISIYRNIKKVRS